MAEHDTFGTPCRTARVKDRSQIICVRCNRAWRHWRIHQLQIARNNLVLKQEAVHFAVFKRFQASGIADQQLGSTVRDDMRDLSLFE